MMWLQFTKEWENYRELTINARLIKLIVIQRNEMKVEKVKIAAVATTAAKWTTTL